MLLWRVKTLLAASSVCPPDVEWIMLPFDVSMLCFAPKIEVFFRLLIVYCICSRFIWGVAFSPLRPWRRLAKYPFRIDCLSATSSYFHQGWDWEGTADLLHSKVLYPTSCDWQKGTCWRSYCSVVGSTACTHGSHTRPLTGAETAFEWVNWASIWPMSGSTWLFIAPFIPVRWS